MRVMIGPSYSDFGHQVNLHHFYHVYAAGNWAHPVTEHCRALTEYGLYDELDSFHVGFVGTPEQIKAVRCTLDALTPNYEVCAEAETGWEQTTLNPLYQFVQHHDGLISYAHTKGASRNDPVDTPWRRMMEYHCYVNWQQPVAALQAGKAIAGCYWLAGATPEGNTVRWINGSIPIITKAKAGGIFGGNYWWTHCELLRNNVPPDLASRHVAEHWLGQISAITDLNTNTIHNMRDFPIGETPPDW